jgi:surface polysaccharide O-acyltransferase-like enzyme
MADRNYSMDTLRTLASFQVVFLHYATWFAVMDPVQYPVPFWAGNIYNTITRVCVPLFVMISGNFLINHYRDLSVRDFFMKRLLRILTPLLFWVLFYTAYLVIEMASRDGGNYSAIIMNVFTGERSLHLWYLYMLIGLYFLTPAIAAVRKVLTEKQFVTAGFLFLIIGMINEAWCARHGIHRLWLVWFVDYLGYYMLGASLANMTMRINKYWYLLIYIVVCIATMFLNEALIVNGITSFRLLTFLSLPTVVESLALYCFFALSEIKANPLSKLAAYTFGIYLVHAFIVSLVFRNLKALMQSMPLITIPAASVLTIGLSLAVTYLLTLNRYTRKVV